MAGFAKQRDSNDGGRALKHKELAFSVLISIFLFSNRCGNFIDFVILELLN